MSNPGANINQTDHLLRFNEKVKSKLTFSDLNSNQAILFRLVEATEKYYGDLEKRIAELEKSGTRQKDLYAFSNSLPEEEEEITESIENVTRLEKQNRTLKEKNAQLTKANSEFKKRLEVLTKGGQKYTVDEHAAIFKDDSSAPTMVSFADSDDPEYAQIALTPELKFPVVTRLASLLNRFEEKKFTHTTSLFQSADLFIQLAEEARSLFAMENKVLELRSPIYIFGDIHGNYKDLKFYLSRFNPTGRMGWLPHKLLFLGDYVDRGDYSIEVVARLFIDKICSRTKVFMLRGNHELSYVNSQVETYGQGCFRYQCQTAFKQRGDEVYWAINRAFDCLPLAAIVDHELFCVHGGVPRPNFPSIPPAPPPNPPIRKPITVNVEREGAMARQGSVLNFNYGLFDSRGPQPIAPILASSSAQNLGVSASSAALLSSTGMSPRTFFHVSNDPRLDAIRSFPTSLPGTLQYHESCPLLSDLLWADPAPPDRQLDANGYCMGVRGPDSIMFGQPAVDLFLRQSNLSLVIRGHEDQQDGMQLQCNGKVFTVFSSSNYRDSNSGACLLCHEKRICMVIKQCNLPRSMTHSTSGTRMPSLVNGANMPELSSKGGGFIVGEQSTTPGNSQAAVKKVLMAQPNSFQPLVMPVSGNYNAASYVVPGLNPVLAGIDTTAAAATPTKSTSPGTAGAGGAAGSPLKRSSSPGGTAARTPSPDKAAKKK